MLPWTPKTYSFYILCLVCVVLADNNQLWDHAGVVSISWGGWVRSTTIRTSYLRSPAGLPAGDRILVSTDARLLLIQDVADGVCNAMNTTLRNLHFRGIDGMVDLSIVPVSWALQLVSKKDRNAKKDVPQKLWTLLWRAFLRFSRNPYQHFWNSWYSHIRDFQHSRIYYVISNILRFHICTHIGIP